jgi:hypothetical protein
MSHPHHWLSTFLTTRATPFLDRSHAVKEVWRLSWFGGYATRTRHGQSPSRVTKLVSSLFLFIFLVWNMWVLQVSSSRFSLSWSCFLRLNSFLFLLGRACVGLVMVILPFSFVIQILLKETLFHLGALVNFLISYWVCQSDNNLCLVSSEHVDHLSGNHFFYYGWCYQSILLVVTSEGSSFWCHALGIAIDEGISFSLE